MQPEIETEGILDGERNGNKGLWIACVCVCRQVGAMRICLGAGMMRYANMRERAGMCYAAGEACKMGKNGLIKPIFRGIVDILYDGFRKCFVNCKFTFYITLSSYLKKVKIPKTRKNHSKM